MSIDMICEKIQAEEHIRSVIDALTNITRHRLITSAGVK